LLPFRSHLYGIPLSVQVGKGGIVKDPVVHQEVGDILLSELLEYCQLVKKKNSRTLFRELL
jgi:hypothetical protein